MIITTAAMNYHKGTLTAEASDFPNATFGQYLGVRSHRTNAIATFQFLHYQTTQEGEITAWVYGPDMNCGTVEKVIIFND